MIPSLPCRFRATVSRAVAASLLLAASLLAAGETIVDDVRGFTLELPDGFSANDQFASAAPRIAHAFVLGDPNDEKLDVILFIEDMRGTIGRERLQLKDMPSGFQGRLFTTTWQGMEVDAFEVPEQIGGMQTVTYNVQIPLERKAIQVKLFGARDREQELKQLLAKVLIGLQGKSNWTEVGAVRPSVIPENKYRVALIAFAATFVVGGLVILYLVSKRTPPGTVLAIAAMLYAGSFLIQGIRVREVVLLTGAVRMLGFAGGILGIVDLFRKRKSKDDAVDRLDPAPRRPASATEKLETVAQSDDTSQPLTASGVQ